MLVTLNRNYNVGQLSNICRSRRVVRATCFLRFSRGLVLRSTPSIGMKKREGRLENVDEPLNADRLKTLLPLTNYDVLQRLCSVVHTLVK